MNADDDGSTGDSARRESAPRDGTALVLESNIDDGDGFYDELLHAHDGLDRAASDALNARLILLLCNHVGDRDVIRDALRIARESAS